MSDHAVYLREVADEMTALFIILRESVEQEGLHVIVEGLVVEEEFGQQTEVLAVDLAHVAVHLEHGQVVVAVDLVGWWVLQVTLVLGDTTTHFMLVKQLSVNLLI